MVQVQVSSFLKNYVCKIPRGEASSRRIRRKRIKIGQKPRRRLKFHGDPLKNHKVTRPYLSVQPGMTQSGRSGPAAVASLLSLSLLCRTWRGADICPAASKKETSALPSHMVATLPPPRRTASPPPLMYSPALIPEERSPRPFCLHRTRATTWSVRPGLRPSLFPLRHRR